MWFYVYPNDDKTDVRLVTAVLSNRMFSVKIDSLNPGTYYCIKAYARNAAGVGYSDYEKNCRTLFSLAEISTNDVLEIRPTTAVCGGNVTSDGGLQVFERGVCWSISQNPTTSDAKTTNGTGIGNFTSNITGLTDGTTYYVRAYATNEMGTAYGEEKSFLTTSKPTVTTYPVTEISGTSAVCGGNVTSTGSSAIVARGVCWATHQNPTIEDDKTFDSVDTGSLFTSNITGLTEATTYYVRAYATNADGTSYGEERVFRTLSLPVVSTNAVTDISYGTATCGGNVSSDGGASVTARGVCWSTFQNPTLSDSKTTDGSGTGSFTSNITGLASGTTYYVRAYATNSAGTAYGIVYRFETLAISGPNVSTLSATNITSESATLNGNVTSDGGATVTSRGFVYGTSLNNFSYGEECGPGTGSFNKTISALSPGTTYYYKAFAVNNSGRVFGEVMSFKTLAMPTVSTETITNISRTSAKCGGYISNDGGATIIVRGVCWSTSHNPTISDSKTTNGAGTGTFTSNITGVAIETTYYVRAYATNSVGTAYGQEEQFTTLGTTGIINGHDWVDIGLPSGTCWATCNVGSDAPEHYGGHFAWAETTTKDRYDWSTYTYCNGSETTITKYCNLSNFGNIDNLTTLVASDDVATANWGVGWRMPTSAEIQELFDYCSHTWTTQNGAHGRLFTGPNGNSIFLPACGFRYDTMIHGYGIVGYYWSSSLSPGPKFAWSITFDSNDNNTIGATDRYRGCTVRAVCTP